MELEKHVQVRQEKFGAVVFETLREKVFVANETAAQILCLYQQGKSHQQIVDQLVQDYDADPDTIKADLDEFMLSLKDNLLTKPEE